MHRHLWTKRCHSLRKLFARLGTQPVRPLRQRFARRFKQPRNLFILHLVCLEQRRQLRFPQNLIRVRIPNSAEPLGIGQRSLQSMIFGVQDFRKLFQRRIQNFQPTSVELGQSRLPARQIQRRPLLRSRLRPKQTPILKIKRGQMLLRKFLSLRSPMQPPRNHQMQNQPNLSLLCAAAFCGASCRAGFLKPAVFVISTFPQPNANPLPHPAQLHNFLPRRARHRRLHAP